MFLEFARADSFFGCCEQVERLDGTLTSNYPAISRYELERRVIRFFILPTISLFLIHFDLGVDRTAELTSGVLEPSNCRRSTKSFP